MSVLRLSDVDVRGKRVFIRADLNVPQDDTARSPTTRASARRCRRSAIALARGAAVMVTSHLGRPKEGEWSAADSLAPVAARLSELLGTPVPLVKDWVDGGSWHAALKPGEVVLLENCRFNKGEKKDDDALARKMAALCDVYVQRRVRHRAPRRGDDPRHREVCAGRLRRPAARRRSSTRSARRSRTRRARWSRSWRAPRSRPSSRC